MKFKNYIFDYFIGNNDKDSNEYCTIYDRYATGDVSISQISIHSKNCTWCFNHITSNNGMIDGCECFACELIYNEIEGSIINLRHEAVGLVKKYFYAAQKRNAIEKEIEEYKKRVLSVTNQYIKISGKEKNECLGEILNQALLS